MENRKQVETLKRDLEIIFKGMEIIKEFNNENEEVGKNGR